MAICRVCGDDGRPGATCPRCDRKLFVDEFFIIDVAHQDETVEDAKCKVVQAIHECKLSYKGLKIIRGHGSKAGHSSIIMDKLLPWLEQVRNQYNFKLVKDQYTRGAHILYFHPSEKIKRKSNLRGAVAHAIYSHGLSRR